MPPGKLYKFKSTVIFDEEFFSKFKPKGFKKIVRNAAGNAVIKWKEKIFPLHFKRPAIKLYGYTIRSERYEDFKRRRYGHDDPLVQTGRSFRRMKSQNRLKKTFKKASMIFDPPSHWQFKSVGKSGINRTEEVLLRTIKEIEDEAERINNEIVSEFNKPVKKRKRKKIKG